jgi:TatD DNase family protein
MLFDAHLHFIDDNNIIDSRLDFLIAEAKEEKIERFISNATSFESSKIHIDLAKKYNEIYIGLGVYPTEFKEKEDLKQVENTLNLIENNKELKNKILIGEIGLDYKQSSENEKIIQMEGFKKQIQFANENNLFMTIHSRYAVSQTLKTLINENSKKVIMHWYTSSKKYLKQAQEQGYYITIGPSYLYSHEQLYDVVKHADPKLVLFETDYPVTFDNKAQEPSIIRNIFNRYCEDFELDKDEMEKMQEKHFNRLFDIER